MCSASTATSVCQVTATDSDFSLRTLGGQRPGAYRQRPEAFAVSFLLNVGFAAALLIYSGHFVMQHQRVRELTVVNLVTDPSPYVLPPARRESGGGGGGGDRDKIRASKGRLPRQALYQLTPPSVVVRNEAPKLAVEPTVVAPPIQLSELGPLGDPLSKIGPPSNGIGTGGGIGSGSGGGVGSGTGPGVGPGHGGGIGGGAYRIGGGVSAPRAIYSPDPEYSEEARKAKYQGTVVLWLIVGTDGRPREIRVVRSVGMGLDEKALETVRTWKFEPGTKGGQAVAVQVNVEVTFRLY